MFWRRLALVLLSAFVFGNAVGHVVSAYNLRPAWVLVVAVSALVRAILGATIHLAVVAVQANTGRPEVVEGEAVAGTQPASTPDGDGPAPALSPVQVSTPTVVAHLPQPSQVGEGVAGGNLDRAAELTSTGSRPTGTASSGPSSPKR